MKNSIKAMDKTEEGVLQSKTLFPKLNLKEVLFGGQL